MTDVNDLTSPLARALTRKGYETLTPVQEAMADPDLGNKDALVSAQTGSGKTVAFGIAMAETMLDDDAKLGRAGAPLTLVIAPTRELALQVMRELEWLYAETGARFGSCVGGMDARTERRTLDRGVHIVVGTPGRLRDHITRGALDLSELQVLVLDEADEMLDLGFRDDLEFILEAAPETRRTLLFSATVSRPIATLAKTYQTDAVRVETKGEAKQHSDIEYRALVVRPADKENAIINLLRFYEAQNALVFCGTRAAVNHLTARFNNRGMKVVALSGELSQNERTHALQSMRDGRAKVCIATDVAARGIDLPGLDLVIHADLPQNKEALLHRSGRTGRAGSKGVSALIVPVSQRKKAERLLGWAKVEADWGKPPTAKQVEIKDNARLLESFETTEIKDPEFVAQLLEKFSAEQLASAYIEQYRGQRSAPEEIVEVDFTKPEKRAPRDEFKQSTWISLSTGRNQRAEPRWLLPMICRGGDISKKDIGAIRVQNDETYVQLNSDIEHQFFEVLGSKEELEEGIKVTKMDKAPDLSGPRGGGGYKGKREGGGGYKGKRDDRDGGGYKGKREGGGGYKGKRDDRDGGGYKGKRDDRDGGGYKGKRDDRDGGGYKGKRDDRDGGGYKGKRDDRDGGGYKGKRDDRDGGGYKGKRDDRDGGKPAYKAKPKPADGPRKPRHTEAPKSDFKPKFGGAADAMPSRAGGKPRPKNLGAKDRAGPDASGERKPRHKTTGKGKFAKPSGKKKTTKPMGKKRD